MSSRNQPILVRPLFWAAALGLLPIWALLLFVVPYWGFAAYLAISDLYFALPQLLFGSELFPSREFGTIADGLPAHLLGQATYAVIGYGVCRAARGVARPLPSDLRRDER